MIVNRAEFTEKRVLGLLDEFEKAIEDGNTFEINMIVVALRREFNLVITSEKIDRPLLSQPSSEIDHQPTVT